MARARNIKPSFFANDDLADIDPLGRLLFIGLWTLADREGRLEDRPRRIKAEVLPYDDCNPDDLLQSLHDHGFIHRYEVGGIKCLQVVNFTKHQDPHYKEKASELPAPDGHEDSGKTAGGVSESVRQAVFDRDGRACKECKSTDDLSIDHIVPRSKGGSHDEDNLQTLCRRCNSAKNNRQAKSDLDQSSANDRPMIGKPSQGQSPLIPDSGFPLTDSPSQRERADNDGVPSAPEETSPPATQSSRAPRATRLPKDWTLPDSWLSWALCEQPSWTPAVAQRVADLFRDYWHAKGGADARKVCWEATWRNWVRREKPNLKQTPAAGGSGLNRQEALEARNREVARLAALES